MSGDHASDPLAERVRRLERDLVALGLLTGSDIDVALAEYYRTRGDVVHGARLVVRAWRDPEFADLLLRDGNAAVARAGIPWVGEEPTFRTVANTSDVHNVVVCTLCSCYPIGLLGPSPGWYRSTEYRARVVREPRTVLEEFGVELPAEVQVRVWDASAETRYMVVPLPPAGMHLMDDDELIRSVTQRGLIGTAVR